MLPINLRLPLHIICLSPFFNTATGTAETGSSAFFLSSWWDLAAPLLSVLETKLWGKDSKHQEDDDDDDDHALVAVVAVDVLLLLLLVVVVVVMIMMMMPMMIII